MFFLSNTHYQDACALVFIQIGEFVGRLSDEFKAEYCEMPWQSIKVMRNKNAHNYDYILFDLVWDTIQENIPKLKQYLEKILKDNQS